ncbi:MAG: hypothetical protein LBI43_00350 [Streptococcaceae bacterium]|jgi:hypothetical protein|nr:hypothetical protein [Streptococcaceae bacterium]
MKSQHSILKMLTSAVILASLVGSPEADAAVNVVSSTGNASMSLAQPSEYCEIIVSVY